MYLEGCLPWDVFFFSHSRTYFAALGAFHSFSSSTERGIQALTRTLYMARRSKRMFPFISQRSGASRPQEARGEFGVLWFTAAEPGPEEQFGPYNSQMQQCSRSSSQSMMCSSLSDPQASDLRSCDGWLVLTPASLSQDCWRLKNRFNASNVKRAKI